jgi:hypothetical protein
MVDSNPYAAPSSGMTETAAKLPGTSVLFASGTAIACSLVIGGILGGFGGYLRAGIGNFYALKLNDRELVSETGAMLYGAVEGLLYGSVIGVALAAISAIFLLVRKRLKRSHDSANRSS